MSPFGPEPEALEEADRRVIERQDVGSDPVKAEVAKGDLKDTGDRFGPIPLSPGRWGEPVEHLPAGIAEPESPQPHRAQDPS